MVVEIQHTTSLSESFNYFLQMLGRRERTVVVITPDYPHRIVHEILFNLWITGFPLATADRIGLATESQAQPIKWNRPFILKTRNANLRAVANKLGIYSDSLENLPISPYSVRRAVIDANLWDDTDYMLPKHIKKVAIGWGYETREYPKADYYALLSSLAFLYIPDEHQPEDIFLFEHKLLHMDDVRPAQWDWMARQELACVIDKRYLPQHMVEHIVTQCEKLKIPTIEPNATQASTFKAVLYPISEYFMNICAPRSFCEIAAQGTYIFTTLKAVNLYPFVFRTVSYARDTEALLSCFIAYCEFKEIIESDEIFTLNEYLNFIKKCTWEGFLFFVLGNTMADVILLEGDA